LLGLGGGHGPDTNTHSETANIRAFVKPDLDKATVSGENIPELVHGGTPAKSLIHVVEDRGGVGLTNFSQEGTDFGSKSLRSAHQASPRTIRWWSERMLGVMVRFMVGDPGPATGCHPI
jgi:hypothetical protein